MKSDGGFTLIEALVSLMVLGLLSAMLLLGLDAPRRAWLASDARTMRGEAVEAAQTALRDRLEHVWPVTRYAQTTPGAQFDGETSSLVFFAPPKRSGQHGGLRRYRLALTSDETLAFQWVSDLAIDPNAWSSPEPLLRNVRSLDLAYYGAAPPDGVRRWRPRWSQHATPPELVRVRVGFADGAPRTWPDLLVRPLADVDTECVLQPGGGCRGR
ncbi:prepilin-type N-terminal cleavage/methylation domain-containing protein [Caulobacter sp.]|uniref:prepilin-type N-terminal cleavage/methylation domain-containing protein n=1 Tax=Caulobacter sp. TaxID=78 RepID=UPI003BB0625A